MSIENYPCLNKDEFAEACHHLESQYCRATLGPLRRRWKLRLCTALDIASVDGGPATYIQIIRPIESDVEHDDLSLSLDSFSIGDKSNDDAFITGGNEMVDAEESDEGIMPQPPPGRCDVGYATYEIHLHPTYRVPCLWFNLHGLPPDEPAFNIDTVFRRLVPDQFKAGLRGGIGGIGGISADHHPITGVPSFFIHPCLLGDAISSFHCSRENYLMIWLGLVGGCVDLWVPKEMALPRRP